MTNRQKLILDYLFDHNGQDYYLNIREFVSSEFDNEEDFDSTLKQLKKLNLVFENDNGDTLYKLTYTDLKVDYAISHLTLFYTVTDELILRIEDCELFNTIDDILHDQFDIYGYSHTSEKKDNLEIYTIYFSDKTDREKINKAVRSIDEKEVEEIYSINNK